LSWGTNTAHECIGNNFTGCNTFDPVGGVVIRGCNFVDLWDDGTADASNNAALLWNASIDIKKSNFLANTHSSSDVAHGIEHSTIASVHAFTASAGGSNTVCIGSGFTANVAVNDYAYNETDGSYAKVLSVDSDTQITTDGLTEGTDNTFSSGDAISVSPAVIYTDLVFSGNEKDILNSASGNDALFVSKSGVSNPATSTNTVKYIGSVPISITVKDVAGGPVQGAQVGVFLVSDGTQLVNDTTESNGSPSPEPAYTGSTPVDVRVWVRKSSSGDTRYKPYSSVQSISSTGLTLAVTLIVDPNNNATS